MTPELIKELVTSFAGIIAVAFTGLYTVDQAVKRLWPPKRRSEDKAGVAYEKIAETLDRLQTTFQHLTAVQDEAVTNLREMRKQGARNSETLARIEGRLER